MFRNLKDSILGIFTEIGFAGLLILLGLLVSLFFSIGR